MTVFIRNYIASCAVCQQMKVNTHPYACSLIPIKAQTDAVLPFSQVTCDFITDLPLIDEFDSLMVVVNHGFTKGVISIPCNKTRKGPFTITKVLDPVTYHLKLPNQWHIHPVFHASLLSPYLETETHGPNFLQPPSVLIEGGRTIQVEVIAAHRK
jgi:hypothetical protein